MSGEFGRTDSITLEASSDLRLHQYNIVHYASPRNCDVRSHGQTLALGPVGILDNKPNANQAASVVVSGLGRVRAGAAVTAGRTFTSNASGRAVHPTSGDLVIGRAMEAAAADGDLISALIFPAVRLAATVT